jgi:hypothetical protein
MPITFVDLICSRDFFREKSLDIMYGRVRYDSMHDVSVLNLETESLLLSKLTLGKCQATHAYVTAE